MNPESSAVGFSGTNRDVKPAISSVRYIKKPLYNTAQHQDAYRDVVPKRDNAGAGERGKIHNRRQPRHLLALRRSQ